MYREATKRPTEKLNLARCLVKGNSHPDVVRSRRTLARLLQEQGRNLDEESKSPPTGDSLGLDNGTNGYDNAAMVVDEQDLEV